MKKKLEAELVSIAHRILQLKNKSDLLQLHKEAQNLYEKLSLLKFVEENFADAKPTIGYAEIESQIEAAFGKEEEADAAEGPETKSKKAEKENKAENAAADKAENKNEDKSETTEAVAESESPEADEEENAEAETPEESDTEEAETPESSDEESAAAETSEASATEEPEESEASDTAATEESKSSEEENAEAVSEENPVATDEVEIPETPEQPESREEVQSALAYNNTDEIEAGEEIPAAEDAGVSEAGDAAPKEDFAPSFELAFDKKDEPKEQKQIAFEDFLGHDYNESFFVKAGEENKKEATRVEEKHEEPEEEQTSNETEIPVTEPEIVEEKETEPQDPEETAPYRPLSEHLSKTITIGLNDRIGFEKQLFGGSSEDLNRVLSQLNTFNTFQEAQDFIEDMVRPDYNWDGKDDYVQRFLDIVEKKFS